MLTVQWVDSMLYFLCFLKSVGQSAGIEPLQLIPERLDQQMQQTHMNFELHMTPTITE